MLQLRDWLNERQGTKLIICLSSCLSFTNQQKCTYDAPAAFIVTSPVPALLLLHKNWDHSFFILYSALFCVIKGKAEFCRRCAK